MTLNKEAKSRDGLRPLFTAGDEIKTHSGLSLLVRSADKSDQKALAEFFSHVSQDDLRFRFLSAIKKVDRAQLAFLTEVDHRRVENFLAFHRDTGALIASAMLAIEDDLEHAEVAIVIHSDFKNQGIGWSLLQYGADEAAAIGVATLQAIESPQNRTALRVERDMGFTSRPLPGDASLTLLEKALAGTGAPGNERAAA